MLNSSPSSRPRLSHDVLERVRVYRLLERLAQQVLPALGVGQLPVDRQHDVVRDQRLRGGEEAEVALEHQPLVLGEAVARAFHSAMSACMETSVGIQWLLQPARYLSQAHWYFNGSSWLTSARAVDHRLVVVDRAARRSPPTAMSSASPVGHWQASQSAGRRTGRPHSRIVGGQRAAAAHVRSRTAFSRAVRALGAWTSPRGSLTANAGSTSS